MTDPFEGMRPEDSINVPDYSMRFKRQKRNQAKHPIGKFTMYMEDPLREWFEERAGFVGISTSWLLRDVLAAWKDLVVQHDADNEIDTACSLNDVVVPERYAGYRSLIYPSHRSHLDNTPAGLEDLA